jgi:hypothetical protein
MQHPVEQFIHLTLTLADFGTSIIYNFTVGGINSIETVASITPDYLIYPNPANEQVNISGLTASDNDKILRVYSPLGTLIYETKIASSIDHYILNVSGYPSGVYCFVISNEDGEVTKKVMVTK